MHNHPVWGDCVLFHLGLNLNRIGECALDWLVEGQLLLFHPHTTGGCIHTLSFNQRNGKHFQLLASFDCNKEEAGRDSPLELPVLRLPTNFNEVGIDAQFFTNAESNQS